MKLKVCFELPDLAKDQTFQVPYDLVPDLSGQTPIFWTGSLTVTQPNRALCNIGFYFFLFFIFKLEFE